MESNKDTWLVTGGAGFIGSTFVRRAIEAGRRVVNLDAFTYAGHHANLVDVEAADSHVLVHGDINDRSLLYSLLMQWRPAAIIHLAAESHVDRSIADAGSFLQTNVVGTWQLLEAARAYHQVLPPSDAAQFRFVHVSTDEVYGDLGPDEPPFSEGSPYRPNSPYAASKAASDHFVRAAWKTYGLPTIITHSTNNFGPRQLPEKLVPLMVVNAAARRPLPIYGDGLNVRDWFYVDDHSAALEAVVAGGVPGEVYDLGGGNPRDNLTLVRQICALVDAYRPDGGPPRSSLITFVADRPGHDRRYAVDDAKARQTLAMPTFTPFDDALAATVRWYLDSPLWVTAVTRA